MEVAQVASLTDIIDSVHAGAFTSLDSIPKSETTTIRSLLEFFLFVMAYVRTQEGVSA